MIRKAETLHLFLTSVTAIELKTKGDKIRQTKRMDQEYFCEWAEHEHGSKQVLTK